MARRGSSGGGLVLLVILGVIGYVVIGLVSFIGQHMTAFLVIDALVIAGAIVLVVYRYQKRKREWGEYQDALIRYHADLRERMSKVEISADRSDYVISNDDYNRGTPRENFYRKTFLLPLLSVYGNRCANCGSTENGVDIDHFIFSKNSGGSFAMLHREGHWVNNAIPLCQTCNRSKLDQHHGDFFDQETLVSLFEKNVEMTKRLNETPGMAQFLPGAQPTRTARRNTVTA